MNACLEDSAESVKSNDQGFNANFIEGFKHSYFQKLNVFYLTVFIRSSSGIYSVQVHNNVDLKMLTVQLDCSRTKRKT